MPAHPAMEQCRGTKRCQREPGESHKVAEWELWSAAAKQLSCARGPKQPQASQDIKDGRCSQLSKLEIVFLRNPAQRELLNNSMARLLLHGFISSVHWQLFQFITSLSSCFSLWMQTPKVYLRNMGEKSVSRVKTVQSCRQPYNSLFPVTMSFSSKARTIAFSRFLGCSTLWRLSGNGHH